MALRTQTLSRILARDPAICEYDFWHALRKIEDELYDCFRLGRPIPIELVYARRIISAAWSARKSGQGLSGPQA